MSPLELIFLFMIVFLVVVVFLVIRSTQQAKDSTAKLLTMLAASRLSLPTMPVVSGHPPLPTSQKDEIPKKKIITFAEVFEKLPPPPRMIVATIENMNAVPMNYLDVSIMASCSDTLDYLQKFISILPLELVISTLKYAIKASGASGAIVDKIIEQLDKNPSKESVLDAIAKLRGIICG